MHDYLQRAVECAHRATFFPFGHALHVESNDARALEIARTTFGFWPRPDAPGSEVRMRLLLDPEITTAPPWPPAVYRAQGDIMGVARGGCFAFMDLAGRYSQAHFSEALVREPETFRHTFLYAMSQYPLQHHYFSPVHCCCVARGGRGFCLTGPSGAGKTTLAYYSGRHGFDVVAEDMVYVNRSGAPVLRGSAYVFHLTAGSAALFPELVQYPVTLARNGKECLVVPAHEQGVRWLSQAPAGGVVLLERGGRSGLEKVPPETVAEHLYNQLQADKPEILAAHRQTYERLAACGSYRLGYASLEEGLELLKQL